MINVYGTYVLNKDQFDWLEETCHGNGYTFLRCDTVLHQLTYTKEIRYLVHIDKDEIKTALALVWS